MPKWTARPKQRHRVAISDGLVPKIRKEAKADGRTFTQQVNFLLAEALVALINRRATP